MVPRAPTIYYLQRHLESQGKPRSLGWCVPSSWAASSWSAAWPACVPWCSPSSCPGAPSASASCSPPGPATSSGSADAASAAASSTASATQGRPSPATENGKGACVVTEGLSSQEQRNREKSFLISAIVSSQTSVFIKYERSIGVYFLLQAFCRNYLITNSFDVKRKKSE